MPSLVVTDSSNPLASHGPEHAAVGLDEFTATIWAPSSTRTQGQGVRPSQTLCRTRAPPTAWSSVTRPLRRPSLKRAPSTRPSPQQGLVPPTLSTGRHFTETTEAGGKKPTASPASYRSRPGLFPALALCYWWGGGGGGLGRPRELPPLLALPECGLLQGKRRLLLTPGFPDQSRAQSSLHQRVTR